MASHYLWQRSIQRALSRVNFKNHLTDVAFSFTIEECISFLLNEAVGFKICGRGNGRMHSRSRAYIILGPLHAGISYTPGTNMENLALTPCVSILLAHWSQVHDPEWYDPHGRALIAVMNDKSTKASTAFAPTGGEERLHSGICLNVLHACMI